MLTVVSIWVFILYLSQKKPKKELKPSHNPKKTQVSVKSKVVSLLPARCHSASLLLHFELAFPLGVSNFISHRHSRHRHSSHSSHNRRNRDLRKHKLDQEKVVTSWAERESQITIPCLTLWRSCRTWLRPWPWPSCRVPSSRTASCGATQCHMAHPPRPETIKIRHPKHSIETHSTKLTLKAIQIWFRGSDNHLKSTHSERIGEVRTNVNAIEQT